MLERNKKLDVPSTFHKYLNKSVEKIINDVLEHIPSEPYIQYYGEGLYKVTAGNLIYYTGKSGAKRAEYALKQQIMHINKEEGTPIEGDFNPYDERGEQAV